ncbi:MAG: hypothetical protein SFW67_05725 [Myxococcaceae bacterium]|nr:hypothetical protein [Myxococcaceae bacterium]
MLKSVNAVQRNALGQMLAQYVNAQSMWPDDGPFPVLRDMALGRAPSQFSDAQRVVLRIAFDIFDGSGGGVTLVEAADALAGKTEELRSIVTLLLALSEEDAVGLMLKEHGIEVDASVDPERAALLARGTLQ